MSVFLSLLVFLTVDFSEAVRCDRAPFRTTFPRTESNGRFRLNITQGLDSDSKYLPDQQYEVTLTAKDPDKYPFTAFMVWPEGQIEVDPLNPRARTVKDPGIMRTHDHFHVKISDRCPNTIEMINAAPTNFTGMYWKTPVRGNGCVTLHAMVAENEEVWYQDGEGLIMEVCEDDSFMGDMSTGINENCAVCEEAKYELKFEGKWSRNTHPHKFPENDWEVYYGDMVGASHSTLYSMWKDGSTASEPMSKLARFANTSDIEEEILQRYSDGSIRTLIKGKGHGPMNGDMSDPTFALVRVDREHHLISTAVALRPSPDWFLGISEFELCQEDNTWLPNKSLDLIPWDAGVDNGISYESPYEESNIPVGRVRVGSLDRESPFYNLNYKQVKPFATLTITLIRTYPTQCAENEAEDGEEGEHGTVVEPEQPEPPARRTSPPPQKVAESDVSGESGGEQDVGADDACPLSEWEEWTPCSNRCGTGYRSRSRYHVVNGVQYRYYRQDEKRPGRIMKPSEDCIEKHVDDILETEPCEGPCGDPATLELVNSRRNRMIPEPGEVQDCVMSSWSRWSACDATCGEGEQLRTRSIIRQPRNGVQRCSQSNVEVRKCSSDPC